MPEISVETEAMTTVAMEWETLEFDLSEPTRWYATQPGQHL
jgi:hypothetical protein